MEQIERPDVDGAAGQIDRASAPKRRCGTGHYCSRGRPYSDATGRIVVASCRQIAASPSDRAAADRRVRRANRLPVELRALAREFGLGGVILFARNVVEPEQVAELCVRGGPARAGRCRSGCQRRSGRRPRRAAEGAVHRVAADGDARAGAATTVLAERFARRSRPSSRPSASRSTTRRCSTFTPTRRITVIGDRALAEKADDVARLGAAIIADAAGAKASPPAANISRPRRHAAPTRTTSCRSSSIRRSACAQVEFVPFRAAIDARRRERS